MSILDWIKRRFEPRPSYWPGAESNDIADAYYQRYREGLVRRHISANGRFLQHTLLIEGDPLSANWRECARRSIEQANHQAYDLVAYPVVLNQQGGIVIGGGDNPLLSGGLAMAVFAMEAMHRVSAHSFDHAVQLLNFFERSENPGGNLRRRRHWWAGLKYISKDEYTGCLLGLHYLLKAARQLGRPEIESRAAGLLRRLGQRFLGGHWAETGVWAYRFPYTRLFKFDLGTSYRGKGVIPTDPETGDEFLDGLLGILISLSLVNRCYSPRGLFNDICRFIRVPYATAVAVGVRPNFFNVAQLCHCCLMIMDQPVTSRVRRDLWQAFRGMFRFFVFRTSVSGSGDGSMNALLAITAHALARSVGADQDLQEAAFGVWRPILDPMGIWYPDLPLCSLPGHEPLESLGIGEHFTWEHRSSREQPHRLLWTWEKTQRSLGVGDQLIGELYDDGGHIPHRDRGFMVEGSGLDYLYARILAAHLGLASFPFLQNDRQLTPLSFPGPQP